jgi:hypothetical protein
LSIWQTDLKDRNNADYDIAIHPRILVLEESELARGGFSNDHQKPRGLPEVERHVCRRAYRGMYAMAKCTGGYDTRSDYAASAPDGKVCLAIIAQANDRPVMYTGEIKGVITRSKYLISIAQAALSPTVVEESDVALKKIVRQPVGVVV